MGDPFGMSTTGFASTSSAVPGEHPGMSGFLEVTMIILLPDDILLRDIADPRIDNADRLVVELLQVFIVAIQEFFEVLIEWLSPVYAAAIRRNGVASGVVAGTWRYDGARHDGIADRLCAA